MPTPPAVDMSNNLDNPDALHTSSITSLPLHYRGKVRDIYTIDDQHWLMIATDRVSAFDVIMPNVIPGKGKLLTQLALFWFDRVRAMIPNHLANIPLEEVLSDPAERAQAAGRCMIIRRLNPLPVEAVVRGYLIGSGWSEYQQTGAVCGVELPQGLLQASKLDQPIFTPATKAELGDHDENISFERMSDIVGGDRADEIRRISLALYNSAAQYTLQHGIITADTKFEFGTNAQGNLVLMDEILTPDSSRYWEADTWQAGTNPQSFDKQFVRDWLELQDWDKQAPGPTLPDDILANTKAKYQEAVDRLTA